TALPARPKTETRSSGFLQGDRPMGSTEPGSVPTTSSLVPPPPALVVQGASSQYEFSDSESTVIGSLGSKMSFVGLFMLGIGLFFFISGLVRWAQLQELDVNLLFLSLLFIVVGIWTHRAGREFRSVARTQGRDISHLMTALGNMLNLYTLLYLLFF